MSYLNVYAIVDGVTYDLTETSDIAKVIAEDGLGVAPVIRFEERGPSQRGSTDRGFRYRPRLASYVMGIQAWTDAEMADKRDALQRIFRPTRTVIMRHLLANGKERWLDCVFYSGLSMAANEREAGRYQKTTITMKADDPMFYDPVGKAVTFQLGGGTGLWEFPWEIPWGVGASSIDETILINYDGDAPSFPSLIRITGPINDPIITNTATGEVLDFTGASIAGGDWYDLDLHYGLKTVVNSDGVDVFDTLAPGSDHATWHIAADDEVEGGVNPIRVQGSGITATTRIDINYFDTFGSI